MDESRFDRWVESALPAARQGINIIECIFDAEAVIIGGQMPQSLVKKIVDRLHPLLCSVRSKYRDDQRLRIGMTGTGTVALGAAALPIFDEFNPQYEVLLK